MLRALSTFTTALAFAWITGVATQAAITTSLPNGIDSDTVESVFEARGRVDGYQTQTWKTAIWGESGARPVTDGGIIQNYYNDEQTYDWAFDYDATTGVVNWSIEGLPSLDATFELTEGSNLVGFKVYARADEASSGGSTVVDNMQVTYNGKSEAVANMVSGQGNPLWVDETWYFNENVDSFSLSGQVTFDWLDVKKTKTERYKFGIKAVQGVGTFGGPGGGGGGAVVPSPTAIWAGVALIGYTVMRRVRRRRSQA